MFKLKEYVLPLIQMNTDPIYKVKFWDDPWLEKGYIIRRKLSFNEIMQTGIHQSTFVMDVLHTFQGLGRYSSNQRIQIIWDKIRQFSPLQSTSPRIVWGEKKAGFKIGETYKYMQRNSDMHAWTWWKRVWNNDSSMRENLFLWKVLKRAILTKAKLASMGMNLDMNCPFCSEFVETVEHLFFECDIIMQNWAEIMVSIDGHCPSIDNSMEWNRIHAKTGSKQKNKRKNTVVLKSFLYAVWKERNTRIFDANNGKTDASFKIWIKHEVIRSLQMMCVRDPGISLPLHL
jgi:hypothetical protein